MHIDRPHPSPLPGEKVIAPIPRFCIKSLCQYCAHGDIIRSDVKQNWDERVYAGNGSCPPLCLCTRVMTGGDRTGGHNSANKSRSNKIYNTSPAITHDTIKSHIATCRSVKWCHEMGGTVPRSHPCTLLLLPLSILESKVLSSYAFLGNGFYHFVKTYVGSLHMMQQALVRYLLSLCCAKYY